MAFSGAAGAAPILDQAFDATGGGHSAAIQFGTSRAQTFTAGLSGKLSTVGLMLNRAIGATGTFSLAILSASGGVPDGSGATLFSQSFDVSPLPLGPFNFTYTDFDVSSGNVFVTAGQQYAIAVSYAIGTGPSNWLQWDTDNNFYAGGAFFTGDGDLTTTWVPLAGGLGGMGGDGGFRTFVDTAAVNVPAPGSVVLFGIGLAALGLRRRARVAPGVAGADRE